MNISDQEARELWRRAAELQAAAERGNNRAIIPAGSGLSLVQIAQAAEGAGIDPDYVRVAVAEKNLSDADRIDRNLWTARWLRVILREPDSIDLSQLVEATPAEVYSALRTVAARPNIDLMLEHTVGEDPLHDAVLVYRMGNDKSAFQDSMDWSDARVFLFTIRPENDATRLRVRVPLYRRGINLALTGVFTTALSAGGMSAGAAASGALPAAIAAAGAIAALPVAIGGVIGGVLGMTAYRALYRWTFRDGEKAVARLLQAIAMEAKAER